MLIDKLSGTKNQMKEFKDKYGPWALITGASAGIGKEIARQVAERGLNVALAARRSDKLEELAAELWESYGIQTRTIACDLGRQDFLETLDKASEGLEIGLLINNAGAPSYRGSILDRSSADLANTIHFNVHVQAMLAYHYGKKMALRGRGGIIQVASMTGHFSMPHMTEYSASKAYQIRFGECLHYEFEKLGVDVLVLSPGATKTERLDFGMDVKPVVRAGLRNLGRRPSMVTGLLNQLVVFRNRHLWSRKKVIRKMGDMQAESLGLQQGWQREVSSQPRNTDSKASTS